MISPKIAYPVMQMDTNDAVSARYTYATRLVLDYETDPPDNIEEVLMSDYARAHRAGDGFKRVVYPRLRDDLISSGSASAATSYGLGRRGQWVNMQAGSNLLEYGLMELTYPANFKTQQQDIWFHYCVQFKGKINH